MGCSPRPPPPGCVRRPSWPLALAALAASGRLERERLLDRCLGRLLQGGPAAELRGFLLLHEALDPTLEQVAARTGDYTRLLADGPPRVAQTAQRALRRLDDAGRLEPDRLVEGSRAVLFRPEKQLVRAQLSWLDAAARRQPQRAGQVLDAVAVAFAQESAELQTRALSVVLRHARHADAAARAELLDAAAALPADLAQRVASALGSQLPVHRPTPPPALLAPTPRELPPPIGTPAELAEELAALLEGHPTVEPVALERLLAALVAFARRDRAALADGLDPVLARYRIQSWLPTDPVPAVSFLNEYQQLSWAVLAAVAPPAKRTLLRGFMKAVWGASERRWRPGWLVAPGPRLALLYRLHEIAVGLGQRSSPPLLVATPTAGSGQLDPGELVARLEQAAAAGWEPWEHDLQQALLRLPRAPDPAATARARRLPTPAGQRLFAWLRDGGMADPQVTRVVRTMRGRPRWSPDASRQLADEVVGVFATVAPPGNPARPGALPASLAAARRLLPRRPPPLAALLCQLPEPERWERWHLGGWQHCWPALLPSHRDALAAQLLPWLANRSAGVRGIGQLLPALAEADGPVGPGLTLALAYGLGARDPVDRAAAVDALLVLAGRHQLEGRALGVELGGPDIPRPAPGRPGRPGAAGCRPGWGSRRGLGDRLCRHPRAGPTRGPAATARGSRPARPRRRGRRRRRRRPAHPGADRHHRPRRLQPPGHPVASPAAAPRRVLSSCLSALPAHEWLGLEHGEPQPRQRRGHPPHGGRSATRPPGPHRGAGRRGHRQPHLRGQR